ncbi:hypothetical protein [Streptomyces peucetius]|uniref:Uncharacterized protein n=1 Tax=Streptomyces peucetius TaxID=1950 RepID=A0ABY6IKJ1_STRPE|nr:hypothetical protein [Streptomyces peucetius]UYQ66220.1 hypothetical protein OGH68_35385 [Streptomyces peucetius]
MGNSSAFAVLQTTDPAEAYACGVRLRAVMRSCETEEGHAGRVHTLTGPEAVTAVAQTAQLAELLGRPLRCEELDQGQARAVLGERYPQEIVEVLFERAERLREGGKAR